MCVFAKSHGLKYLHVYSRIVNRMEAVCIIFTRHSLCTLAIDCFQSTCFYNLSLLVLCAVARGCECDAVAKQKRHRRRGRTQTRRSWISTRCAVHFRLELCALFQFRNCAVCVAVNVCWHWHHCRIELCARIQFRNGAVGIVVGVDARTKISACIGLVRSPI